MEQSSILWNAAVRQYFCDVIGFGVLISFPLAVLIFFRGVQAWRGVPGDPVRPIQIWIWKAVAIVIWAAFLMEAVRPHDSGKVLGMFAYGIGLDLDWDDEDSLALAASAWRWSVAAVHFPLAGAVAALGHRLTCSSLK